MGGLVAVIEGSLDPGTLTVDGLSPLDERGYAVINYYGDGSFSGVVIPLTGTSTILMSPDGLNFLSVTDGVIDWPLTAPAFPGDYKMPTWTGPTAAVQITSDGTFNVGVTHFRLSIFRYRSN